MTVEMDWLGSASVPCPYQEYDPFLCDLCNMANPYGSYNASECTFFGGTPFDPSGNPSYPSDIELKLCSPDGTCHTVGGHVSRGQFVMESYPANDFYPGGDTGTECPFSYDPYLCDLCDMSNPNGMYNEYDCSLYGGYTYSSSGDPGYCDYASPNYDYYLCDICDGSSPYFDQYSCEYSGGTVFNISGSNNDPYGPGLTYPLNGGTPILEFTYNSNELVDLGFDFGFYGDTYNQITVSSNGLIYFGDVPDYENGCCSGSLLPAVTPAPTIHLFHTEFLTLVIMAEGFT